MYKCLYDVRMGSSGGCPDERALDFDFCPTHLNTPRGRQHVMDTIARGNLTLPSQVQAAIDQAQVVDDVDYQTSALEKLSAALDLIQGWTDEARRNLDSLGGPENWRYKDRAGTEQSRTELGVYERAMDRLSRHITAMSKAAVQEKIVTLGKAQVDMMIRIMLAVISEMRLPSAETDKAKMILLSHFEQEANLTPRVEKHVQEQLAIDAPRNSTINVNETGGVTGVSIGGERIA